MMNYTQRIKVYIIQLYSYSYGLLDLVTRTAYITANGYA